MPRPILEQTVQVTKPGIVQFQLPKQHQELVAGKEYRWSISITCNPNRPSTDMFVQSFIQQVVRSPELNRQLIDAKSSQERARILAQAGLWYDALETLSAVGDKDATAHAELLSLLDQVGLKTITSRERKSEQAANPSIRVRRQ